MTFFATMLLLFAAILAFGATLGASERSRMRRERDYDSLFV